MGEVLVLAAPISMSGNILVSSPDAGGRSCPIWVFHLFIVKLATMLTNSKRRAIHDFIAGSVVVSGSSVAIVRCPPVLQTPSPSIERTCQGPLCAPCAAAHVKR